MPAAQRKGRIAEDLAAGYLSGLGFKILRRNVRLGGGELDIVALEGEILAFVEVKAGLRRSQENCLAAVDRRKIERMVSAGEAYLAQNRLNLSCRFDVVAVDLSLAPPACRLLRDAFRPEAP